jgi:transcriptional regulator with XRE-family HTH domain
MPVDTTQRWRPTTNFATRLRAVRRELGLQQDPFAALVGFPRPSVAAWEGGTRPRDLADVVQKISAATGVDRDWLMWGDPSDQGGLATHRYFGRELVAA